ncbi:EamA family transporter [uncultured Tateyamaria sp.]|uniref:EamA family transporter n=1 Tax=uncultured Tateyamaria sp. TaxID=455651 RepID=UPI0026290DEE|nr:EamA family transporter [uncultured Tateyamaria sp.]
MDHLLFGFSLTFVTAMIVVVGDYAIKLAADGNQPMWSWPVILGVVLYGTSALFWFYAMQHVTLAQAGVAYSMLTLIALAIIGAVYFGETLHAREYAGLGCALLSMILMSRLA